MSQCKPRLSKNGLCKTTTLHRAIFLPVFLLLVAFAQAQSQYCVDFCGNGSETVVYDENLEYYVGQSNPNIALYKIDHVFPNYWNLVLAVAGEPVFNYRKIGDGSLPPAGTYSLINGSAPPCPISVEISVCGPSCQPPMAFAVTGGGAYCSGGSGLELGLDNSESGVDYHLQIEGSDVGSPVAGTGAAISFGDQTAAGTYTVVATNTNGGCTAAMSGSATVTVNALPTAYAVTGGGAYCSGGSGVIVSLANSESGMEYQLQIDGNNVGFPYPGLGSVRSFDSQTAPGIYTVVATNTNSGCTAAMSGSATVTVNTASPVTISGTTTFCPGSSTTLSVPEQAGATYCWASGPTWETVGSTGFSASDAHNPRLAFSGSTPYLAYRDLGNGSKATLMKFNGTDWEPVGSAGFSPGSINNPSLAFSGSTPYVAFRDGSNSGKARVMAFNGTAWETVGSAGFSAGSIDNPGLAFSGSTPYVAYKDNANGGKATVMTFNGTTWETVGSAGFSPGQVSNPSLAISGSTPYVAYRDGSNSGKATVMKFNGTDWETVGSAGFTAGRVFDEISLAFSGSTPYVAYTDNSNGYKATVMKFNGTAWETVGGSGFSHNQASNTSLAFLGSTPYVAYKGGENDNFKVTVMRFNGTNWEAVGSANFSAAQALAPSLAFSGSTPYVAYQDGSKNYKASVMKFLGCLSDVSSLSVNAEGTYTVIATDNNGCTAVTTGSATVTANTAPSADISGTTSFCPGSSTTLSVPEQAGATYCWATSGPPIWRNVGNAGFSAGNVSNLSLAFSSSTPYVAYQDGGNDNKATVMQFNGTAWETVGNAGFSAGTANNPSLAFLGSTPYVAYQDGGNGNKATVMKFNGTAWETVGNAGFSTGAASNTNLAFSGSTPYVAYADIDNNYKATVMAFNGTTWETVGSAGFSADFAGDLSLAFSGSTPYVAYQDGATSYKATVMKYNGTAWETVGSAGFSTGEAYNLSLAFTGGTPYVAYQDETTGYKATAMKYNGTSWETVGSAGFSIDQAFGPSLAFYGSTPYVAYTEGGNSNNKARVMKFNGTDWETVGNANFSAGQAYGLRIAFSGNTPYVAYLDGANGDRATVMKFALCLSDGNSLSANAEGTYIVTVTGNNGCTASASQAVTVITGTSIYTVTGGGTYCGSGDGVEIGLDGSQIGATYQLKLDGENDGSPIDGTGNALSFGNKTAGGTYTVVASVPDGCAVEMTGNAVVTVGPIPTVFEVTGGGPICSENPATVYIQMSGSEAIQYDLLLNGDPNFTFYGSGDGNPLPVNPGIAPGTYTIVATGETGCTALMSGSATLTESNYCIQDIELVSPQCDAQNTTCTEDDTYTTDVVVHFAGSIPPTGTLEVHFFSTDNEVSFSFSVPVSELSGTSYTFTGLTFNADKIFEANAAFSETGTVAYQTAFPGTGTCSSGSLVPDLEIVVGGFQGPCDVLNNAYAIVEDGTFAHPSLPGFVVGWNGTAWILGGLTSSTPFAYAPGTPDMVPCTGWVASPGLEGFCGLTTLSISGDCGMPLFAPPPCAINGISASNLSGCNNPGNTPSAADDYFTADVTVNFAFAPGSGDLTLKRGTTVLATKAASDLACATSWVFEGVQMTADGSDLVLTAEFSAACTFTSASLGTAPVSCSCVPTAAFTTCPTAQSVNVAANTCAATVNYTAVANGTPAPTYTYTFSGATTTFSPQNGTGSGSSFNLGQTTVTVMANNECGTAAPCTFTVTVKDNEAPTVTCPANTATINTNAGASCQITVPNYVASLSPMDNCTASNSIVEAQSVPAGVYNVSGHGATVTVNYTATDGASPANTKTCTVTITVNDAAPPTVNCPSNIAASATTSACTAAVSFTATATDNCGTPTITYSPTSGSVFNVGTTTVTATATDGSGKTATCSFTVSVSCQADFSGRILWKRNATLGVKDVTVTLTGDQTGSTITPLSGMYALTTAPGANFEIKPTKNLNKLNGVNAQDVLRINQHVAASAPLTDLYDWVAADVNGNNSITALDANIIQLSLLGNPQALAQWFSSWRFIPTAHVLSNPPWGFPEKIALSNSGSNTQTGKDFYGIKVGDVASTYANPANAGQGQPLVLRTPDQTLQAGQTIGVTLAADPLADLAALQFALGFDPEQLQLESMETLDGLPLQADNFGTQKTDLGKLRFLWAASGPTVSLKQTASIFRLRFKVLESGNRLSEVLHLDDEALPGHVYDGNDRESGVALRFDASTATGAPSDRAGLQLLQNQPNPFLEQTTIGFVLPEACEAQLRIVDAGGRVVAQRSKQYAAGRHSEWFELQGLSGVLYYELSTPFGVMARKMVVLTE